MADVVGGVEIGWVGKTLGGLEEGTGKTDLWRSGGGPKRARTERGGRY